MAKTKFISARTGVHEFRRFTGFKGELDKSDLIAWTNDAVERISSGEQLVTKLALLQVNNYSVDLGDDFKYMVQASYKEKSANSCTLREQVSQYTQDVLGSDCKLEINVKCPSCHSESACQCSTAIVEVDADQLWRTSNPQHAAAGMKHFYGYGGNTGRGTTSANYPDFRLMKHTTSSFFNVPYHINECVNLNFDCEVEYSIHDGKRLVVNFKEGEVLISYMGVKIDEDGYRMVPDEPVVMRAISYAMAERYLYRKVLETGEQKDRILWQMHIELTEKWVARARAQLQTPDYDEFSVFIKKFWHKVIPEYSYEENLYRGKDPRYAFKYPKETRNIKGFNDSPDRFRNQ